MANPALKWDAAKAGHLLRPLGSRLEYKPAMRAIFLVFLIASSAFAEEFTVDGSGVGRPDEVKQYGTCDHFAVTAKDAALFFLNAHPTTYQYENLIVGPCKVYGAVADGNNSNWEIYIGGAGVIYRKGADPQWYYCGKKCCATIGKEICG